MSGSANHQRVERNGERGATLVIVALSLMFVLAATALSIDLGSLYLQRSEAQRAADAGALAGAQVFANSGCALDGSCLSSSIQSIASTKATLIAQQNLIFGKTPTVPTPTFAAGGGNQNDPLITVTVQTPAKTFFLPLSAGAQISAKATAEAYNPGGAGTTTGPTVCTSCLKPFFVPNCDPNHTSPANSLCPAGTGSGGGYPAAFFNADGTLANGTDIVGREWQLHYQKVLNNGTYVPSQWLEVAFDSDPTAGCPGGQTATGWSENVIKCSTKVITCGTQLCTKNGNMVGPNNQAVGDLISYGNGRPNGTNATDSITCSGGVCTMTAGSGNPFATSGQTISQSSALISVPVYDGTMQSGGGVVTVVGYMQLFVKNIQHQGQDDIITAVIVGAMTCGTSNGGATCSTTGGGSGTGGTTSGGGATLIPVRLVHD
ncbi:MAG TPA: pilus assembly protein TadG-related protein [Terriglobales bacterium]|nr:pilus assembly protein TadG-related protein [Terriglobales bacterium]